MDGTPGHKKEDLDAVRRAKVPWGGEDVADPREARPAFVSSGVIYTEVRPVTRAKRGGKCSECGEVKPLEPVTLRMYERRRQFEWRYRVCDLCCRMIRVLLSEHADATQEGFFDHQGGVLVTSDEYAVWRTRRAANGASERAEVGVQPGP